MISTLEKIKRLEKYLATNNSTIDPVIETTINKLLSHEFNRMVELKNRLLNELQSFCILKGPLTFNSYKISCLILKLSN